MPAVLRWILIAFVAFIAFRFLQVAYRVASAPPTPPAAGEKEFEAANSHLTTMTGKNAADGNSVAAQKVAQAVGPLLQKIIEKAFTGGKPGLGELYQKRNVVVYCELRDDSCAFLIYVPELRQYSGDALAALKNFAWLSAQTAIEESDLKNKDIKIAVGLRGTIFYGPIQVGKSTGAPTTEVEGMSGMKSFYPFFVFTPEAGAEFQTGRSTRTDKIRADQASDRRGEEEIGVSDASFWTRLPGSCDSGFERFRRRCGWRSEI